MRRFAACLSASCALAAPSLADQRIGSAASIEKDVRGAISGREERLAIGSEVYAGEVLTTGLESRGKFSFVDRTDLQMGPSSRVKLDSFVYSGDSGVTFNAAKGVFRFISAPGGHKDYQVRTPTATIGVRGTIFGVRASRARTDAVLINGVIEVCRADGGGCRVLDAPCTTVTVTAAGVTRPKPVDSNDWTFDGGCKPGRQGGNEPPPGAAPAPLDGAPPIDWSGFFFGFNAGAAIGAAEFADPIPLHGAAFLGGPSLGYNWRLTPDIVAGFEVDAEYRSDIGGGTNGLGSASSSRGGYLGSLRVRLGYAFDRWLVFGAGGLAYGHIIAPKSFSGFNVITAGYTAGVSQNNPFLPGWAAGGGVQYALTDNLSLKAEYLYVKLQHDFPLYSTNVAPYPLGVCNVSGLHSIRLGVSYGFSLRDLAAAVGGN